MTDDFMNDITSLADRLSHLNEEAYHAYKPLVEYLCHNKNATDNEVGLMLDCLLPFCGSEKVLGLYKKVCRAFYEKSPETIHDYINMYREEYEDR